MKACFREHKFGASTTLLLTQIEDIVNEYSMQGFVLTIRQLYYQLVSRDLIANELREYNRIVRVVGQARMAGIIDWAAIEDRGRLPVRPPSWESPSNMVDACAEAFKVDRWKDQPYYIEVMIEKQALEGVIEPVCRELDVTFTANKGYSSLSAMYRAGQRFRNAKAHDKKTLCLYLGDHDPSGLDMSRDIDERLYIFGHFTSVECKRLALNMDQVDKYSPPPNPAKTTDSRFRAYMDQYGEESWELDALEPRVLAKLVQKAIIRVRDDKLWKATLERELEGRQMLADAALELEDKW